MTEIENPLMNSNWLLQKNLERTFKSITEQCSKIKIYIRKFKRTHYILGKFIEKRPTLILRFVTFYIKMQKVSKYSYEILKF